MRNLFGEGRHPDAERLENAALDAGKSVALAKKASQLGRVFARYLGNQPEFIQETAKRYVAYNLAQGEHWKTPVPAEVRAKIRTELGNEHFLREHGRAPIDDRERGSFMAKATRQQTTAVAGYDLTFAPVKSVSTLWALADRDVAKEIEAAHHSAVEATLSWLEKEVLFTRRGRGGIQQVKATGLIAGMFTHRDARSSDPHLHTHVALSNKVQDETGRWLAVDGRVLFKANVTLAEMYNTLIESELIARLGVRFENRRSGLPKGVDKRPVREIVGVDERLAQDLVQAAQRHRGPPPRAGGRLPGRARSPADRRRGRHPRREGMEPDPPGQARTPRRGRPARRLAGRGSGHHRQRAGRPGHGRGLSRTPPGRPGHHRRMGRRDRPACRRAGRRGPCDLAGLAPARRGAAPSPRPRRPAARPRRRRRPRRGHRDRRPLHRLQRPRPAHPRDHRGRAERDDPRSPAAHRTCPWARGRRRGGRQRL